MHKYPSPWGVRGGNTAGTDFHYFSYKSEAIKHAKKILISRKHKTSTILKFKRGLYDPAGPGWVAYGWQGDVWKLINGTPKLIRKYN